MWILKNKKGFTLIEVLCSITIFNLIFITIFSIGVCNFKLRHYNEKLRNCTVFMEELKNNIIYEAKYDSILKLKASKKYYIESENIKPGILKEKHLEDICSYDNLSNKSHKKPYIELNIENEKSRVKENVKIDENSQEVKETKKVEEAKENKEVKEDKKNTESEKNKLDGKNTDENDTEIIRINIKFYTTSKIYNDDKGCDLYRGKFKK